MLPGSGARICSKCGVTRVTRVANFTKLLYLMIFIGVTPIVHTNFQACN